MEGAIMGGSTDPKGIIIDVCQSTMDFLRRVGLVTVVHDNNNNIIVYRPTPQADRILRDHIPDPDIKEAE